MVEQLPTRQRKEIKHEILTLLGLHHRPKPALPVKHNAAPTYMMDLYNTLHEEEVEEGVEMGEQPVRGGVKGVSSVHQRQIEKLAEFNLTMPGMERSLEDADMIMSFVNNRECLWTIVSVVLPLSWTS